MSKTETKRRKTSAKERQKAKVAITAALVVVLIVLVGVIGLVSCGSKYADATTSTVYVLKDGSIVTADVEAFDETKYNEDELKSFVKDALTKYNDENGKDSVKQKSLKVNENIATLVLEYASISAFKDFTGTDIFVGTIAEAIEAGYAFDGQFASVSNGIVECTSDSFLSDKELKVVIIRSNTTVNVEGDIMYLSAANISAFTENTVTIRENCSIFDLVAPQNTESQTTQNTQGTEGTEQIPEGAVGEDELQVSEEETEVVFDFGQEDEGSKYTDVYVYIIFK